MHFTPSYLPSNQKDAPFQPSAGGATDPHSLGVAWFGQTRTFLSRVVGSARGRHHQKSEHPRRNSGVQRHPSARPTRFDYIAGGETLEEFLKGFPTVSRESARAALEQAKPLFARSPLNAQPARRMHR